MQPYKGGLTPKMKKVYDFIKSEITEQGISPSYNEIMKAIGAQSTSEVARLVNALVDRGFIENTPFLARSIRLV